VHNGSAAIAGYLPPNSVATQSARKIRRVFIFWKLARGHIISQIRPFSPPQLFLGLDRFCPTLPFTIPRMKLKNQFMQTVNIQVPEDQFTAQVHQVPQRAPNEVLPIHDALQIKAAEYWLKLGEADQALRELEALPSRIWKCGWAIKTRIAAIGVLRERDEMMVQA
jgi:hypothetical protein